MRRSGQQVAGFTVLAEVGTGRVAGTGPGADQSAALAGEPVQVESQDLGGRDAELGEGPIRQQRRLVLAGVYVAPLTFATTILLTDLPLWLCIAATAATTLLALMITTIRTFAQS